MGPQIPGTHQFINPRHIPANRDLTLISGFGVAVRIVGLCLAIIAMWAGLNLLAGGAQQLSEPSLASLMEKAQHPLTALALGVLITALIQSSSATTTLTVSAVGSGVLRRSHDHGS